MMAIKDWKFRGHLEFDWKLIFTIECTCVSNFNTSVDLVCLIRESYWQRCERLQACLSANGGHFEHI